MRDEATGQTRPLSPEEEAVAIADGLIEQADQEPAYSRLDEATGEWVPIHDYEAWQAGVWQYPGTNQIGVKDPLATPAELASRDKGFYDPRSASGKLVRRLVNGGCAMCGTKVVEIDLHERRALLRHVPTNRRYWADFDRWSLYRCTCGHGLASSEVWEAADRARRDGKAVTISL